MKQNTQSSIDEFEFSNLAEGGEETFSTLVHIIYKKLFPFTVSLIKSEAEADDILQEVFLKIWLHRESLSTMESPMGWIFRVIATTASNHLRSKLQHERRIQKVKLQPIISEDIEGRIDAKLMQSMIAEAVNQLPVKRKQVFLLSKKEGLSRKDVAEQLHISENTVRNQLAESIKFIHSYLSKNNNPIIPVLFLSAALTDFF